MRFEQAREILNRWTRFIDDGKDASTNKSVKKTPNQKASQGSWWHENNGTMPDWRKPRTVAYLTAYIEMAGAHFPLTGILLEDGYLWPDRAVMRSLLVAGCIRLKAGSFHLTEKGEALIAPWLTVS
jgi:hypothetical protein